MDVNTLHTSTLEKLYGPIACEIIRQDDKLRIVHLMDKKGISRTVGVVRFYNTDHKPIEAVHKCILEGGLLGKTLQKFKIDYRKDIIGALPVRLPDWIQKDFLIKEEHSIAMISHIKLEVSSGEQLLYTKIIEVLPPELSAEVVHELIQIHDIDKDLLPLFESVDLLIENIIT